MSAQKPGTTSPQRRGDVVGGRHLIGGLEFFAGGGDGAGAGSGRGVGAGGRGSGLVATTTRDERVGRDANLLPGAPPYSSVGSGSGDSAGAGSVLVSFSAVFRPTGLYFAHHW